MISSVYVKNILYKSGYRNQEDYGMIPV